MRFTLILSLVMLVLGIRPAIAAPIIIESHSHNGRIHKHQLPASGTKHFHKHMHNGRAHIHPFSAEVGFNHTHNKQKSNPSIQPKNKDNSSKEESNNVKHNHGGKFHSHVLPPSGINHLHRHWHGKRSHIHPLTENGAIHFHPEFEEKTNKTKDSNFDQQVAELLKRPVRKVRPKKQKKKIVFKKRRKPLKRRLKGKKQSKINQTNKNLKTPIQHDNQENEREIQITNSQSTIESDADVVGANRQYEIGLRYENGTGTSINLKQAFKWYTRAAKKGDARAQFNLASLYENGRGVKRDLEQAVKWYRKAAENKCHCSTNNK